MGVLADIYVASRNEAAEYDADPKRFAAEAASWKLFTELELSILWALLQGREWDVELMDRFENVLTKDGGERMITRLPDEFIDDILSVDEGRIEQAVNEWAVSEELGCDPEEVRPFVDDLKRLAQVARSSGRSLFLWNSV
ncbi:MAG TPA: hypothetical protein VGR35_12715 [Tepidisphaeraceae bacterium]|nr:hypothetical protein [Tepidisphaeraceae bacterium]